jgi:hypothetical protein
VTEQRIAEDIYAPNQQLVRPDGSGPAEEGEGGSTHGEPDPKDDLDDMTKDELLAHAQQLGVTPANASMNKADLLAGIKAHQAKT